MPGDGITLALFVCDTTEIVLDIEPTPFGAASSVEAATTTIEDFGSSAAATTQISSKAVSSGHVTSSSSHSSSQISLSFSTQSPQSSGNTNSHATQLTTSRSVVTPLGGQTTQAATATGAAVIPTGAAIIGAAGGIAALALLLT